MTIDLTPEQEAFLRQQASLFGKTVGEYLVDSLQYLNEGQSDSLPVWTAGDEESLRIGLEQADRGEFIESEEMDRRVAEMLNRP